MGFCVENIGHNCCLVSPSLCYQISKVRSDCSYCFFNLINSRKRFSPQSYQKLQWAEGELLVKVFWSVLWYFYCIFHFMYLIIILKAHYWSFKNRIKFVLDDVNIVWTYLCHSCSTRKGQEQLETIFVICLSSPGLRHRQSSRPALIRIPNSQLTVLVLSSKQREPTNVVWRTSVLRLGWADQTRMRQQSYCSVKQLPSSDQYLP